MATYYELTKGLSQAQLNDLQKRAESGGSTQGMNSQAMSVYSYFQDQARNRVVEAAQSGRQLSAPNDWKNSIYNQNVPQAPQAPSAPTFQQPSYQSQVPQAPSFQAPSVDWSKYQYQSQMPQWDKQGFINQGSQQVNQIWDKQKESQLKMLESQRNKAMGVINQQKSEVKPMYEEKKNEADVVSHQNVQRLRELMAAQGLQSSGENVTASVGLASSRQKALNDLNLQEQQIMNEYDRAIRDVQDTTQDQAIIAQLEAARAEALMSIQSQAESLGMNYAQMGMQDAQFGAQHNTNLMNMQNQLALQYDQLNYGATQDRFNNILNEAQMMGSMNGSPTLANQQWQQSLNQWQQQFDQSNKQWQQQFDQSNQQFNSNLQFQKEQFTSEQKWREHTYKTLSATDKAQIDLNKKQFGEEMAWKLYEMKYSSQVQTSSNQALINFYKSGA